MSGKKTVVLILKLSRTRLAAYKSGENVKSHTFAVNANGKASKWYLDLYPNGRTEDQKGYMSLCLRSLNKDLADIDMSFRFGINSKKDKYISKNMEKPNWKEGEGFGFNRWISHVDLLDSRNEYIVDGCLTIFCEIEITGADSEPQGKKQKHSAVDFCEMFDKEELKDCELHMSDDKVLSCHKIVLAAQSKEFENIFTNDLLGSVVVKINDIDSETMMQLLRFVYGLDVEDLNSIAHKLIYAAEKYQIMELKYLCFDSLMDNLNEQNVLDALVVSERITDATALFKKCLKIITKHYKTLNETPQFKQLPEKTFLAVMKHVLLRYKPTD